MAQFVTGPGKARDASTVRILVVTALMVVAACGLAAIFISFYYEERFGAAATVVLVPGMLYVSQEVADAIKRVLAIFALAILCAMFQGFDRAREYLRADSPIHMVSTSEAQIKGRVIRSGDKVLLFFDEGTKRVTVLQWKDIMKLVKEK